MKRNGWEHSDLEKEIAEANVAQLLDLFKREDQKYADKCKELVNLLSKLTEEGKKAIEEECQLLEKGRQKVALSIAERLTN